MPIGVMVRTYTGKVEARSDRAVNELCAIARAAGLPLLGHVAPYDNTVFNQVQMAPLVREIQQLPTRRRRPWRRPRGTSSR